MTTSQNYPFGTRNIGDVVLFILALSVLVGSLTLITDAVVAGVVPQLPLLFKAFIWLSGAEVLGQLFSLLPQKITNKVIRLIVTVVIKVLISILTLLILIALTVEFSVVALVERLLSVSPLLFTFLIFSLSLEIVKELIRDLDYPLWRNTRFRRGALAILTASILLFVYAVSNADAKPKPTVPILVATATPISPSNTPTPIPTPTQILFPTITPSVGPSATWTPSYTVTPTDLLENNICENLFSATTSYIYDSPIWVDPSGNGVIAPSKVVWYSSNGIEGQRRYALLFWKADDYDRRDVLASPINCEIATHNEYYFGGSPNSQPGTFVIRVQLINITLQGEVEYVLSPLSHPLYLTWP